MMDNGKLVITKNDLTDIANFFFLFFMFIYTGKLLHSEVEH